MIKDNIIPKDQAEIFVIDDDQDLSEALKLIINKSVMNTVQAFTRPNDLLAALNNNARIFVVDQNLKDRITGLELIKMIVDRQVPSFFIMLSGQDPSKDASAWRVLIDYMNSTFGCRYIEKATEKWSEELIDDINEFLQHINALANFFSTRKSIETGIDKLLNLNEPTAKADEITD